MSKPRYLDPEAIIPISRGSTEAFKTGSWSRRRPEFVEKPSPCRAACPNGNNIAAALYLASRGDFDGALGAYLEESALPGVCGRVCNRPCQAPCNRVDLDGALEIRALERFVSDRGVHPAGVLTDAGKDLPVTVVGSGPAGLSAAYHLARMGHPVTLLEARERLGGLLTGGLPRYRLPEEVLERDLARILSLGIVATTGQRVDADRLAELRRSNDAVLLASGAWTPRALEIPGEQLDGVVPGLDYLLGAAGQERVRGKRVVVIGGGNTAMDAARVALRRGAVGVSVLYRRTRDAMPAFAEEVSEAEEEGVEFHFLVSPTAVLGEDGRVAAVRCQAMRVAETKDGVRPAVSPIADQYRQFPCDVLLSATGQALGASSMLAGLDREGGRLRGDGWGRTTAAGVYVAGDAGPGRATVVDAMASAKRAAVAIHRDLMGQGELPLPDGFGDGAAFSIRDLFISQPIFKPDSVAAVDAFSYLTAVKVTPCPTPRLEPSVRVKTFAEVSDTFRPDSAKREAERCFFCGTCVGCDYCAMFCPEVSIGREPGLTAYRTNPEFCKGCGACASVCVRGVLTMGDER